MLIQERLERERKERLKQKEKERKERRKKEGKPVTKKEREAEARRQAQLAALQEQGVWTCACACVIWPLIVLLDLGVFVPEKSIGEKKKVLYGSRHRKKENLGVFMF